MPEIAQFIVEQNSNPTTQYKNKLNYKGFAVGNPFTDHNSEYPAMFFTYVSSLSLFLTSSNFDLFFYNAVGTSIVG